MSEITAVHSPEVIEARVWEYQCALSTPSRRLQLAIKRVLDLMGAALALAVLSPLMALLALLIRLESPGAAIFTQQRLARWGRLFTMYKFRSMVDGAPVVLNPDGSTCVADDDPRVTRLGAKLRYLGLDELPQLINVLKGEMSLIGPRPDQDFHLQYYADGDYRKLTMRPGITSLAQVSGRNALSWNERMALEIEYVECFSLRLDLQIAWRTVGVVLRGIGVNNPVSPVESDPDFRKH